MTALIKELTGKVRLKLPYNDAGEGTGLKPNEILCPIIAEN
jgi:hypothetical protein